MNYDNRLEEKSVSWVAAFSVFVEMAVRRVETAVLLFPPESVADIDHATSRKTSVTRVYMSTFIACANIFSF